MFGRSKYIALIGLMLVSCAGTPAPRTNTAHPLSQEVAIFAAAIRGILERSSMPPHVDPRPIRISDDIVMPEVADYYPNAASATSERMAVLRELGIDTVQVFPVGAGCSGFLVPPSVKRTDECPAEVRRELAFDRVRPAPEPNRWLLRMISVHYTPRGRGATTYELTIAAHNEDFVLEQMVALVHFD